MASRTPTADVTRIAALLGPVVAAAGYDLEQVTVTRVARRSVVRVVVDADGGVSLDGVAALSRAVSGALDEAGYPGSTDDAAPPGSGVSHSGSAGDAGHSGSAGDASYTLEVSSPGVDRSLSEPRHWRRATGRLVRTRIGDAVVAGRLIAADGVGVVLDVGGDARSVPYDRLGKGSVQVEFSRRESADR